MDIRWSPAATGEFFGIVEYIRQENPGAAQRVSKTIYESGGVLQSFPNRGRVGRVDGTRESPLPPLPFIIAYKVLGNTVEIVNVVHGAQRWPPQK
jgi:plasmid stabilization system protein ParE